MTKLLVAIPCMDMMPVGFVQSLRGLVFDCETNVSFAQSSLVYDSRNTLSGKAIKEGYDRVLWLDSDMVFRPDFAIEMGKYIDSGYDFVTAVYRTRKPPFDLCVYSSINPGNRAVPFDQINSVTDVAGCGFGGVMMTVDLLKKVVNTYGRPFSPIAGLGEDLSFCYRVTGLGLTMKAVPINMGHVGYKVIEV